MNYVMIGVVIFGIAISICSLCEVIKTIIVEKAKITLETAQLSFSHDAKKADIYALEAGKFGIKIPEEYSIEWKMDKDEKKILRKLQSAYQYGFETGYTSCKQDVLRMM